MGCVTCMRDLGQLDEAEHACPVLIERKRQDALSWGAGAHCPNADCALKDVPTFKDSPDQCNVILCQPCRGGCGTFFCYLCDMDLGKTNAAAHQSFPHRHADRSCPL